MHDLELVSREQFEEFVAEALGAIPAEFRHQINNLEFVVEEWPDQETMRLAGARFRSRLLGFYHGVPLTERTHSYYLVVPDKISIYRQPIFRQCRSPDEVRDLVDRVVRHEIAHHFGIDDERLWEIGAY